MVLYAFLLARNTRVKCEQQIKDKVTIALLHVKVAQIYLPCVFNRHCVCMCFTRARIPKELHSGIAPLNCSSRSL